MAELGFALFGVAVALALMAGVYGAWLLLTRVTTRPGPVYEKPFRKCPTCGTTYDDPMDLFHAHIMRMGPDELMTCPKCEGSL